MYLTLIRLTGFCDKTQIINKNEQEQRERWEKKVLREVYGGKQIREGRTAQ